MARLRRSWQTWHSLTWPQRRLLLRAWLLLPPVVVGLRLFGFHRVQAALRGGDAGAPMHVDLPAAQAVARVVQSAARWSPADAKCLARSLVLCRLLRDQGLVASLRIGVAQSNGRFAAHAWVEHGDVTLIDSQDVRRRYAAFERVWFQEGSSAP